MRTLFSYLHKNQFVAALFIIVLGLFLIKVKEILIILFISYIVMTAFRPAVLFFNKRKLPYVLSVLVPYIIFCIFLIILILPLFPFFATQIQSLLNNFPVFLEKSSQAVGLKIDYSNVNSSINSFFQTVGGNLFSITGQVFGGIISLTTIIVVSFYLLLYHNRFEKLIVHLFPQDKKEQARETFLKIEEKLGKWLRGQLILSLLIGVLSWIFLTFIGIEYALPLAFIAGLLEIIPMIGPILAAVPAVIVALTISPGLAVAVLIGYIVIQTIESNIFVPKIMQSAVGLNPVIIIIAILVGSNLLGVWGALLSVPFVSVATIILSEFKD